MMSCAQMVAAGHCTIFRLNAKKAENEIQKITNKSVTSGACQR